MVSSEGNSCIATPKLEELPKILSTNLNIIGNIDAIIILIDAFFVTLQLEVKEYSTFRYFLLQWNGVILTLHSDFRFLVNLQIFYIRHPNTEKNVFLSTPLHSSSLTFWMYSFRRQ